MLKTVGALLDSREGGTLPCGVADDGIVLGLDSDDATLRGDGKDVSDLFQLALTQAVLNAGQSPPQRVRSGEAEELGARVEPARSAATVRLHGPVLDEDAGVDELAQCGAR